MTALPDACAVAEIALFPLQAVLFPEGRLALRVFEARYLDLASECLREAREFGVVALKQGAEVRQAGVTPVFEAVGCRARILAADMPRAGLMTLDCLGTQRFEVRAQRQQPNGLWRATVQALDDDESVAPDAALHDSVRALAVALKALPHAVDTEAGKAFLRAGWVANRWAELLPIPLAARQQLMALPDAQARLQIVDRYLREHAIIKP